MEGTALNRLLDEFHQHRLGREVDDEDFEGEVFADAEVDFFDDVVRGVDARRDEIDEILIAKLAAGWTLARLDKTYRPLTEASGGSLHRRHSVQGIPK